MWCCDKTIQVSLYLQHHYTDLFDTLDDGLRGPGDSHGSLCGVWQHVSCNLDLSTCGLKVEEKQNRSPAFRFDDDYTGTSSVCFQ